MKKQLTVDFRAYQQIHNFSVTNMYDAIIELITNAIDAYRCGDMINNNNINNIKKNKTIHVNIYLDEKTNEQYLEIVDNAVGVAPDCMEKCFLTVGSLTKTHATARGFFSTGAKNISALGVVHFTSIHKEKLSRVSIDRAGLSTIDTYDELNDMVKKIMLNQSIGLYYPFQKMALMF